MGIYFGLNANNMLRGIRRTIIVILPEAYMEYCDYDEDNLSAVAGSCRYLLYNRGAKPGTRSGIISCSDCSHWDGTGCRRNHLDGIASEMQLD